VGLLSYATGLVSQALLAPPGFVSPILVVTSIMIGIGIAAVMLFPWSMLPDVLEFDELETGQRREGLFYALFTFASKNAYALGAFITGRVLEYTGYVPGMSSQSPRAVLGIRMLLGPLAALLVGVALLIVRRYPITEADHDHARAELARRAAAL
jgi:GPH family glycoside/pentoside/hexuronide:cation symporter